MGKERYVEYFEPDRLMKKVGVLVDDGGILDSGLGYGECSLVCDETHLNGGRAVQGGAIFTLADSAFAVASNARFIENGEPFLAVGQSVNITYVKAAKPGRLVARATGVSEGKRSGVYDIEVRDEEGKLIAKATGIASVIPHPVNKNA
jgi:acyl-CoA thioesterase